ncbi:MAG: hypothetical protein JO356_00890 [Acidobacteria bacterium]|nr:hypothetical protein [Acidobacteriota bacterium]
MTDEVYKKIFASSEDILLDIVVCDTSIGDWQALLNHLTASYACVYSENGVAVPLPRTDVIFERRNQGSVQLECVLMGFTLNCYFFLVHEIELDLLLDDIKSPNTAKQVFKLMKEISGVLKKTVFLTPEHGNANVEELKIFALAVVDTADGSIRSRFGELVE